VVVGVGALASGGGGIGTGWTGAASATATATATGAASEGTGCWRAGGLGTTGHGNTGGVGGGRGAAWTKHVKVSVAEAQGRHHQYPWRSAVEPMAASRPSLGRATDAMRARGSRKEQGIRRRIRRQTQMQRDGGLQTTYLGTGC
jgi:hypothetical protein